MLNIKSCLIASLLIASLLLTFLPSVVKAQNAEAFLDELTDKFIELSLAVSSLSRQVNEFIKSFQPLHPQTLGDYLKDLFETEQITLTEDDFLEPTENPELSFAKMLNLIPTYYESNTRITQKEAEQIREEFLSTKDNLLFDGLFGKIDMHEHYRAGGDVEEFLRAAGSLGISKILFLPTGLNPDNRGYKTHQEFLIKYITELYPEKIIPFCTIDEADPQAAEVLEECLKAGGEGLKLIGGHPLFYDEPMNSENMYRVYQIAAQYQVPVLLHGSIITIDGLKEELDQVYSDFPDVTFIHAHYCSSIMKGINLDQCAELLDNHPNLYIDLSMGGGIKRYHKYFRQDLQKIKDFVLTYQDRLLFGSDIILNPRAGKDFDWLYQRLSCDINLHQQKEYTCQFGEKDVAHQGFNLDKSVLRKLYFENPKKVLGF